MLPRGQHSRIYYTLLTNPASQSPLTSTCSRVQIQKKSKCQRAYKHEQEEFDIVDQVSRAPPRSGERPSGKDCAVTQGWVSDHP